MKNTYTIAEILFLSLITASLFSQNFNYISDYDGQGVPLDMVNTSVSQSLLDNIDASFPEGYPVPDYNPQYIQDGIETNVILTETSDVWVTFVGEGAGYKNVLGFYSYDVFDPPTSPPADEDITIIFPNVSASGSGGGLLVGDKMYLGQFPPNTGIGWVLIANGWNGNQVTYGNWMLYSNPYFNPEGSLELQKHNVNLYDNNEQVVVFGFEDIRRDFSSCDQDFNDALFLVTTNPFSAMDTDNFNQISYDGGGQSSGNDGGLESNRGLSSKIAKRTYSRSQKRIEHVSREMNIRSGSLLADPVPISAKAGDERKISTPLDLTSITVATDVWSADYMMADKRIATVFATETLDGVYDHSKVVCDRLAGSEIQDIKEVEILGQKFLLTTLLKEDKSIEYTISFSILINFDKKFRVFSKWAVDQYEESGKFLNYQIWSAAPYLTIDLVSQIIQNLQKENEYLPTIDSVSYLPKIYIRSGSYNENTIELTIFNATNTPATCNLVGSFSDSETDEELEMLSKTISVPAGERHLMLRNPNGSIFDLELKIRNLEESTYDVAYFADGAWGLDYDAKYTSIANLDILPNQRKEDDEFNIARNIHAEINSKDYMSVFKHFKPSGRSIDLSNYNALVFESEYSHPVTIRIIKDDIDNWNEQYTFVYRPSEGSTETIIPFNYFRNSSNETFVPNDAQMIVFTQTKTSGIDQKFSIENMRFANVEMPVTIESELKIFPNPTEGQLKISFESSDEQMGMLTVYDLTGRKLHQENILINRGLNLLERKLGHIEAGLHVLNIESEAGSIMNQKIMFF